MRVHIDEQACTGHGVCVSIRPDVFELRQDGVAHLLTEHFEQADRQDLEDAVYQCPVQALRVSR